MDFDRDKQNSTSDASSTRSPQTGSTGSPSQGGAFGSTGSPSQGGAFRSEGSSTGAPFASEGPGTPGGVPDDAGTRAGSYDRKFTGEELAGDERIGEKVDEGRERLSGAVEAGRNRVAGQLERISDRLEERGRGMEEAGGVQQRASQVALRAGEALDSGAEYLRSHDPDAMRDDLERSIRERPLLSVGIAAGAGFLLARLLRD